jgi:hypothetical protein
MVIVELPAPGAAIGLGLNPNVVPIGTPEADKLMALLNPPLIVVLIVDVPWLPCITLTADGLAVIAKFGIAMVCDTPRKASVVMSPLLLPLPTTTVSRIPLMVTCKGRLLPGHAVADQFAPVAS